MPFCLSKTPLGRWGWVFHPVFCLFGRLCVKVGYLFQFAHLVLAIFDKIFRLAGFGYAVTFFTCRNIESEKFSDFGFIASEPPSKILAMASATQDARFDLTTYRQASLGLFLGTCVLSVV
jgi:hypothetical protein